jgi:hypothetical protein
MNLLLVTGCWFVVPYRESVRFAQPHLEPATSNQQLRGALR